MHVFCISSDGYWVNHLTQAIDESLEKNMAMDLKDTFPGDYAGDHDQCRSRAGGADRFSGGIEITFSMGSIFVAFG